MGGWALEVGRMAMYMAFPVAMFHFFNQPEYFEKWVTETKREIYPPDNKSHRIEIEKLIREMREKNDQEILKALQSLEEQEQS